MIDHLPRTAQDLVDQIGYEATIKMVELRGGIRVHIPMKAKADHWLVPHIGLDGLKALVAWCAGDYIEVPRCYAAIKHQFERAVVEQAKTRSIPQLARQHHYTERGMRKLIKRAQAKGSEPDNQASLNFGE